MSVIWDCEVSILVSDPVTSSSDGVPETSLLLLQVDEKNFFKGINHSEWRLTNKKGIELRNSIFSSPN